MELQEPALRAMVAHFSWPNAPRFPDSRGAVTDILREATTDPEDWVWEGPIVAAWHEERQLHLIATSTGIDIVSEAPEDPVSVARQVLPALMELLHLKECACGAAGIWLLAAPDLSAASGALEARLARPDLRDVLEPIGGRPSRFAVDLTFEDERLTTQLKVKPLSADDLVEDGEFLSDLEVADLPPAATLVKLRRERTEADSPDDALMQVQRLLEGVQRAGSKISDSLVWTNGTDRTPQASA